VQYFSGESSARSRCYYLFLAIFNQEYCNKIEIPLDTPIRLYLVNMVCGEPAVSFHLHANFFNRYPSGTKGTPTELNDVVTLSLLQREILEEFTFDSKHFTPGPSNNAISNNNAQGAGKRKT